MADKRPNIFISSLARSLSVGGSDTEIYLSTITTLDGQAVTTADFDFFGKGVMSVDVQSSTSAEFCSFTGLSQINTSLTGCIRGLSFKDFTEINANKKFHPVGTPVILSFGTHDIIQFQTVIQDNYDTLFALIEGATIQGGIPASTTAMGISRLSASPNVTLGTATITIASPAVITKTAHELTVNDIVQFTTTGTLPTGISAGVSYYVLSTGLTADDFQISLLPNGTAINTSGTQSGVQTLIKVTPVAQKALGADTVAALGGSSGTPSASNPFITQNDTTNGATETATTIAFVNSNPDTITDSGSGFVTAGFQAGQTITVTGSVSNNNTFTIASVVAGTITLIVGDSLTAESAGATVTISAATAGKLLRTTPSGTVPPGTGIAGTANIQTFTADDTWTKPTGAKSIYVEVIGGGGSGAGGGCISAGNFRQGGSGGGGGAFASRTFKASDLTGTVAVTVGASVTGGAGGTASGGGAADGTDGTVGNTSSFGAFLLAYGGGAGAKGTANSGNQTDKSGGAGGGTGGAGQIGQNNASSLGGSPAITAGVGGQGGSGAGGLITTATSAEYGGGSGGFGAESNPGAGGSSLYGGAGGGAGGGIIDSGTYGAAGAGGNVRTTTIGGGGAAGANGGSNGSNGTAGDSTKCGTGGGGGGANNAAGTAGNGGDGGAPGGGGGGGGAATNNGTAGTGGAGGRGEVRVTTYF